MEYQNGNQYGEEVQNRGGALPSQYKPLSPWAYMGYNLLFAIPLVGLIMLFVFAFSDKNINRRNYARSFFCNFLIALVVSLIVVGAGVVMFGTAAGIASSTNTIDMANYAAFAQEFGEFSDEVLIAKANLKAEYAKAGEIKNDAQLYYEIAKGKAPSRYVDIPGGEKFDYDFLEYDEKCYEITTLSNIDTFDYMDVDELDFYISENYDEKYYVTSKGTVFTLPGFKREEDGVVKYYVTARGDYYTK